MNIKAYSSLREMLKPRFHKDEDPFSDERELIGAKALDQDSVSISEDARNFFALVESKAKEEDTVPDYGQSSLVKSSTSGAGIKQQRIKNVQKQIEAAQRELDRATQALQAAQAAARSDPSVENENDSKDVKDARNLVTENNNTVLALKEELARAMREIYGGSPGGGHPGIRCGGGVGGGGPNIPSPEEYSVSTVPASAPSEPVAAPEPATTVAE